MKSLFTRIKLLKLNKYHHRSGECEQVTRAKTIALKDISDDVRSDCFYSHNYISEESNILKQIMATNDANKTFLERSKEDKDRFQKIRKKLNSLDKYQVDITINEKTSRYGHRTKKAQQNFVDSFHNVNCKIKVIF